jgi:hypothetical protein
MNSSDAELQLEEESTSLQCRQIGGIERLRFRIVKLGCDRITGTSRPRIHNKLLALYQGTTSVVPPPAKMVGALAPPFLPLYGTTKVVP